MEKFTRRVSASIHAWRIACASAAGVCLLAGSTIAAQSRDQLLITPAWLAQHLGDANLVVFHIGPKPDYDTKHIPGARYVAYNTELAVRATDPAPGLSLQMLPPEVLRERLAGLGVSDGSRVVVCFSSGWVSPATRVIETLRYAGFADASLLDGGLPAWEKGGHPVTSEVPPAKSGQLSALKTAPAVVDADYVRAHLQTAGFAIVDARNTSFYEGSRTGGQPPQSHKTGHILGAVSVPFDSLFDASDHHYKSQDELSAIFTKAGVKSGDTVIAYCHIGQQATAVVFAARLLGFKVMLYDGSFEDWSLRDLPVARSGGGSY
jgi:thiosulfate/3-mercaptopyruvate sulfurtransferase